MKLYLISIIACLQFTAPTTAQEGRSVGLAEWVHPDATGQPPAQSRQRKLSSGARVEEREQVRTNRFGAADFVFLNRSRLLVGPGCEVRLDHRYYDRRLDVQISEYGLATRQRCIAKADNLGSSDPEDRIVLKTPRGTVVVANAEVDVVLEEAGPATRTLIEASQLTALSAREQDGDSDRTYALTSGRQGAATLRVSVVRMGSGGYASLHAFGQPVGRAAGGVTIRRADFFAYVIPDGRVFGPERERIINLSDLAGVANPSRSEYRPTPELAPLRSIVAPDRVLPTAPPTCRDNTCAQIPTPTPPVIPPDDPPIVVLVAP